MSKLAELATANNSCLSNKNGSSYRGYRLPYLLTKCLHFNKKASTTQISLTSMVVTFVARSWRFWHCRDVRVALVAFVARSRRSKTRGEALP